VRVREFERVSARGREGGRARERARERDRASERARLRESARERARARAREREIVRNNDAMMMTIRRSRSEVALFRLGGACKRSKGNSKLLRGLPRYFFGAELQGG
jgi:hypothetical protein